MAACGCSMQTEAERQALLVLAAMNPGELSDRDGLLPQCCGHQTGPALEGTYGSVWRRCYYCWRVFNASD